jgi:hypothetical protein
VGKSEIKEIEMIPSFLLAKLYVKGSLRNTDSGFEFSLKNIIDNSMLIGVGPIVVGDRPYEAPVITMTVGEKTWKGEEITRQNPVPARMGNVIRVGLTGDRLVPGTQKISVSATSSDIGKFKFDFSDSVA